MIQFNDLQLFGLLDNHVLAVMPGTVEEQWDAILADQNLAEKRFIKVSDLLELIKEWKTRSIKQSQE